LGGKTQEKIEEVRRSTAVEAEVESTVEPEVQLPTPPSESGAPVPFPFPLAQQSNSVGYLTPRSNTRSTPTSSPPPLEDGDPPSFEDAQFDEQLHPEALDPLAIASQQFDFPDPASARASPTSSIEAQFDEDENPPSSSLFRPNGDIDCWVGSHNNGLPSPVGSDSDMNPFSDVNSQKRSADSMHIDT